MHVDLTERFRELQAQLGANALGVDVVVGAERLEAGQKQLHVLAELIHVARTDFAHRGESFDADREIADGRGKARQAQLDSDQHGALTFERVERLAPGPCDVICQ